MKIHVSALNALVDHARTAAPRECCGVLLAEGEEHLVTRALPGENEERNAPQRRFRLGRAAHLRAVELELAGKARIAGYYHSHPHGGVAPSPHDAEMAAEDSVHLIVSARDDAPDTAAWRWTGESFIEEPLEVIGTTLNASRSVLPRSRSRTADGTTP